MALLPRFFVGADVMRGWVTVWLVVVGLMAGRVEAQVQSRHEGKWPVSVGVYMAFGVETQGLVGDNFNNAIWTLGVYAESTVHWLRSGLDLRCECGDNSVQGMQVGPRVSVEVSVLQPYIEVLFGANHAASPANGLAQLDGVTAEGVGGVDFIHGGYFHWRVVEMTYGSFSGITGSRPFSVSTGVVFRLP